jgi:hypothetical protein
LHRRAIDCRNWLGSIIIPGKEGRCGAVVINDVISSVVTPYIQLRGFEKIWLEPGEKKTVKFKLTPEELSFINFDMQPIVEPGEFRVMVGRSSADIKLEGSFFKKEVPSHLVY